MDRVLETEGTMTKERSEGQRLALVRLSAALAVRDSRLLREILEGSDLGDDPGGVEEVILQSYLFLGYPLALNAFALWREVSGVEAGVGAEDLWDVWERRGEEVCRKVYAGQYEGLRQNVRALHPDMERWMVVEGYGKVLGRGELDLVSRELCIAGLLVVLGTPRQLYSHLRGALNSGATGEQVERALDEACSLVQGPGSDEAWRVWEKVRARARIPAPPPAPDRQGETKDVR